MMENRDGTFKAKTCANGQQQGEYITKNEETSPTINLNLIFVTCATEAKEGQDVEIMDLQEAFSHVSMMMIRLCF